MKGTGILVLIDGKELATLSSGKDIGVGYIFKSTYYDYEVVEVDEEKRIVHVEERKKFVFD